VEGSTSANCRRENPFDILAYNKISGVIFFDNANRGSQFIAECFISWLETWKNRYPVMPINASLKLRPADACQPLSEKQIGLGKKSIGPVTDIVVGLQSVGRARFYFRNPGFLKKSFCASPPKLT